MNIIKPNHLSLLSRPYRWQQQDYLGVAAIALLEMSATPALRDEQTLWQRVGDALQSPDGVLDMAIPKACAEFLVSGFAHAAPEHTQVDVLIQIDQLRKQQRVANGESVQMHAIAMDHPMRQALMGQDFDDRWLQHDYPGFPRDTDWRVFNQAAPISGGQSRMRCHEVPAGASKICIRSSRSCRANCPYGRRRHLSRASGRMKSCLKP